MQEGGLSKCIFFSKNPNLKQTKNLFWGGVGGWGGRGGLD